MEGAETKRIYDELRAIDATVSSLQTQVTQMATQFAVHTAMESSINQQVRQNTDRVEQIWDWRNRMLGAIALATTLLGAGIIAVIIRVYGDRKSVV